MIQYRLIKVYPGSPKLGTIHWFQTDEFGPSSNSIWQGTNFYNSHPQFWQKVEEVDYEILKVIDREGTVISKNGYTFPECFQTLVNAKDTFEIFSVKRLSDGEVFTIGDEISTGHFTKNAKIDRIAITTINYQLQGIWVSYKGGSCALSGIIKVNKTPLFTTEDGVDFFKSDFKNHANIYSVNKSNFSLNKNALGFTVFTDACLKFSTKEKAEEWILLNKPVLSLNDLLKKFYPKDYNFKKRHNNGAMEDIHTNDLIELAKSKL